MEEITQLLNELTPVQAGDNVLSVARASRINAMQDLLRAIARGDNIIEGKGIRISTEPGGVIIEGRARSQTGESLPDHPWKPYVVDGLDVKLIPGTVNNRLPGNWNATFSLSSSQSSYWVWLEATINQRGDVSSCSIETGAAIPTPAAPGNDGTIATTLYAALFAYDSSSSGVTRFYQVANENLATEVTVTDPGCEEIYRSVRLINA